MVAMLPHFGPPVHPRLSDVAHVIDAMMTEATTTERATSDLLAAAQADIASIVA